MLRFGAAAEDCIEGKKEASLHVKMLRRWAMEGMQ